MKSILYSCLILASLFYTPALHAQWSIGIGINAENGKQIGTASEVVTTQSPAITPLYKYSDHYQSTQTKTTVYPSISLQRELSKDISISLEMQYTSKAIFRVLTDTTKVPTIVTKNGVDTVIIEDHTDGIENQFQLFNALILARYRIYDEFRVCAGFGLSRILNMKQGSLFDESNLSSESWFNTVKNEYSPQTYLTARAGLSYAIKVSDRLFVDISTSIRYDLSESHSLLNREFVLFGNNRKTEFDIETYYHIMSFQAGCQIRYTF